MNKIKIIPTFGQMSLRFLLAIFTLFISQTVQATDPESVIYSNSDWDLVCDNTRTCRAAGYSDENAESAASVLLTRQAGPATPVTNKVILADDKNESPQTQTNKPQLLINGRSLGDLSPLDKGIWQMDPSQYGAFMQALFAGSEISFDDQSNQYALSSAGANKVLTKMDEVQGRFNTPGALIKKGDDDESVVRSPLPRAVIIKAPVLDKRSRNMTEVELAVFKPALMKIINSSPYECTQSQIEQPWQIARLNEKQSLISAACWVSANNGGDIYFIVSNDMSSAPVEAVPTANSYKEGVITEFSYGRGMADCKSYQQWVWDGESFVESAIGDTGRCPSLRADATWNMIKFKATVTTTK